MPSLEPALLNAFRRTAGKYTAISKVRFGHLGAVHGGQFPTRSGQSGVSPIADVQRKSRGLRDVLFAQSHLTAGLGVA